jgi:N-methylhydantoinase A
VTDADLVLGYLDASSFLGGRMRLDRDKALRALDALGKTLGMDAEEVAVGMFRIINAQMADLIRRSTVEQGHDPRHCVLVAYGGAGPTHATFYGRDAGVKSILVPAASTVFSAEGMLTCDIVHTAETSLRISSPPKPADLDAVTAAFAALDRQIMKQFADEGGSPADVGLTHLIGVRYRQQVHTVEVPVPDMSLAPDTWNELVQRFAERYAQLYGRAAVLADASVETDALRVVGRLPIEKFDLRPQELAGASPNPAFRGERPVYFEGAGHVLTPVYSGDLLKPGNVIAGPAIVQRMGDSVVVPAGHKLEVDRYLTLVIKRSSVAERSVAHDMMARVQ